MIIPNCNTSPTGYVLFYIPAAAVPTGCATATTGTTLTCSTPYQVWARQLTPGSGSMTTCYTDTTGTFCNTGMTLSFSGKTKGGGNPFVNATNNLLFNCQAPAGTTNGSSGSGTTAPIFQDPLANYFWDYDTTNLRLVQLRFYPMPAGTTTTTSSTCTFGPMP